MTYTHREGVEGIAKDLKQILSEDFEKHFNLRLYKGESNKETVIQPKVTQITKPAVVQSVPITQKILPLSDTSKDQKDRQEVRQLSIFDLYENPPQESIAVATISQRPQTKKRISTGKRPTKGIQTSLFSGFNQQSYLSTVQINKDTEVSEKREVIGDLFSQGNSSSPSHTQPIETIIPEPAIYTGAIKAFHRNECFAIDNGWVGYLKDFDSDKEKAIFHPLQLSTSQKIRTQAYIEVRDTYLDLYQKETENHTEHKAERESLNNLYDAFIKKYGNLNSADNVKLIKTDSAGKEIPYLERVVGGVVHKADIFHRPVSFSTTTLATDNPDEALSASLNKFGNVHLDYMSDVSGISSDALKESLRGRIYYNPLEKEYEIAERWIAGNVVEKVEVIKTYLEGNPNDTQAKESLTALEEARPRRIEFEELDFNLGERWIPTGIYARFASHLFDTDVNIHYSESTDDFSISCK